MKDFSIRARPRHGAFPPRITATCASTMKPGGVCWLPGGAGAMGQMHTQLAVENRQGPVRFW